MKLKRKLLLVVLSLTICMPSFAMVQIPDTFTYENIEDTLIGGTNKYIIASDNTIMANGTSVQGLGNSVVNTGGLWKPVIKGANGVTLNNIVKIVYTYSSPYALDSFGNAYYISGYPQKIEIEGVKFKDVGEIYYKNNSNDRIYLSTFLVTEDGSIYKGTGKLLSKREGLEPIESIFVTNIRSEGYSKNSSGLLLTKSKELYWLDAYGTETKVSGVTDVEEVYKGATSFYLKFTSGNVCLINLLSSVVTQVDIPKGEDFIGIFSSSETAGLTTNKGIYILKDNSLTKATSINTKDSSAVRPVTSKGDLAVDNQGKYYTWTLSGTEFKFIPIDGIEEWANDNPIVTSNELANFDIPLNKIFKRLENYEFNFNLVTQDEPKQFNVYFCKNEDRNDKLKWKLIEGGVDASSLSPKVYDTGYVNASGKPITGFSYTYNWKIGNDDLVGVHLIVEPIYE